MTSTIIFGECRAVMGTMPENSVDAIVCDPPYDLTSGKKGGTGAASLNLNSPAGRSRISTGGGFMGKTWDGTGVAFDPETWQIAMNILKPGGFLLAFGGSRTFHRLTCAIEDAGFEIRDCLSWLYGSGFPKSLDVSKAFDKAAGAEREVVGVRQGHEDFVTRIDAHSAGTRTEGWDRPWKEDPDKVRDSHMETAPATDLAKQWDGWGTALKPSWEPIVMARKPLIGTVIANVQEYGTGALNIDACRIGDDGGCKVTGDAGTRPSVSAYGDGLNGKFGEPVPGLGRWPANVILDEEVAAELDERIGPTQAGKPREDRGLGGFWTESTGVPAGPQYGDEGGPSRYMYCAKASAEERLEVNNVRHPTQKPIALMKWLVKMVTPPGGIVLDPFAGSGTTLVAAEMDGFESIGIEMTEEYLPIIEARVKAVMGMFADVKVVR